MLKIIKFPNSILRTPTPEWDFNSGQDAEQLEKDLIETMFSFDGIGLAAPQVGISARVFVMGYRGNPEHCAGIF